MRKLDMLHLAAAAAFAVCTSFAGVGSVQAAGLSDRQKDVISDFMKCKSYLLTGNLSAFEADSDCGNSRAAVETGSMGSSTGSGGDSSCSHEGGKKPHHGGGKKHPRGGHGGGMQMFSMGGYEGGGHGGSQYCHSDDKPGMHKPGKKPGKKHGKKPGGFHGFPGNGGPSFF